MLTTYKYFCLPLDNEIINLLYICYEGKTYLLYKSKSFIVYHFKSAPKRGLFLYLPLESLTVSTFFRCIIDGVSVSANVEPLHFSTLTYTASEL